MEQAIGRWLFPWGLLALLAGPAWAQSPEEPVPESGSEEPLSDEAGLPELPTSFREGWLWSGRAPTRIGRASSVAILPTDPQVVAVAGLDGRVWLSEDGTETWQNLLGPLVVSLGGESGDEDVLLGVEALIEEFVGNDAGSGDFEPEEDEELDADDLEELARDAAEQVRADLRSDPWFLEQQAVLEGRVDAARPQVWFGPEGELFVGRADGLHLSEDRGASWTRALDIAVTAFAYLPQRGLYVVGTGDGTRFSTAEMGGQAWIDPEDGTEGLHIFDLAAAPEGLYAGTARGLWFAEDAQAWRSMGLLEDPVTAVLPDPDWELGLWYGTQYGVQRSDDGGRSSRSALGAALRDVVDFVRVGPGRVLAAGAEGVWESSDGGLTWMPVTRGLTDPDCRSLARQGNLLLLASDDGVMGMGLATGEALPSAPVSGEVPAWIPVEILIDAALGRAGVEPRGRASRGAITAVPVLFVEAAYNPEPFDLQYRAGLSGGSLDAGTTLDRDGLWYVMARMRWTPAGRKTAGQVGPGEDDAQDVWVLVDGGEVYVDSGENPNLMAARVTRLAAQNRNTLISEVTSLYYAREELLLLRPSLRASSVLDRVENELKIQELEARLDMLTEGAVRRWSPGKEDG